MITKLDIENYKSIQKLSLSPGRVNLFIGKPASGKSNIIEAISLLSKRNIPIKEMVRMKEYNDLIYDADIERKLSVEADQISFSMEYKDGDYLASYTDTNTQLLYLSFVDEIAMGQLKTFEMNKKIRKEFDDKFFILEGLIDKSGNLNYQVSKNDTVNILNEYLTENIFYYKFKLASEFNDKTTERLNAPFGNNLPQIILTRGSLKKIITEILSDYDLKLGLNPNENTIKILKEQDGVLRIKRAFAALFGRIK
jgi:AAA15 family ATPase/GTPase